MSDLIVTVKDAIATVTLNRPAQRNAMTLAMWQGVASIFSDLSGIAPCAPSC